jgi:beta-1,4-galactosyltransferase 3
MNVAPRISNYKLPYANYFGGVSAVRPQHMIEANGFSNSFFGWGGEDDDFAARLKRAGFRILRDDPRVARKVRHSVH